MVLYSLWWGYLLYFLYGKEYDNNLAGAWASAGMAALTVVLMLMYIIGFAVAAVRDKAHRSAHLRAILLVFAPAAGIATFEFLR